MVDAVQPTRLRRQDGHQPVAIELLARGLPAEARRDIAWREGVKGVLSSRFTALRMRPAHRDEDRHEPWAELWLLVEWPSEDRQPTKYWFANLPSDTPLERLVHLAKLRWRIERDYQELKQELGLGHYEGRGWRGFHHHAALCIAAYGFLVAERLATSPSSGGADRARAGPVYLRYPKASCLAAVPARAERHVTSSIATKRAEIAVRLAQRLPRCPCCLRITSIDRHPAL